MEKNREKEWCIYGDLFAYHGFSWTFVFYGENYRSICAATVLHRIKKVKNCKKKEIRNVNEIYKNINFMVGARTHVKMPRNGNSNSNVRKIKSERQQKNLQMKINELDLRKRITIYDRQWNGDWTGKQTMWMRSSGNAIYSFSWWIICTNPFRLYLIGSFGLFFVFIRATKNQMRHLSHSHFVCTVYTVSVCFFFWCLFSFHLIGTILRCVLRAPRFFTSV